jgi:hypothetical protein
MLTGGGQEAKRRFDVPSPASGATSGVPLGTSDLARPPFCHAMRLASTALSARERTKQGDQYHVHSALLDQFSIDVTDPEFVANCFVSRTERGVR